jgi:hypothetical protein
VRIDGLRDENPAWNELGSREPENVEKSVERQVLDEVRREDTTDRRVRLGGQIVHGVSHLDPVSLLAAAIDDPPMHVDAYGGDPRLREQIEKLAPAAPQIHHRGMRPHELDVGAKALLYRGLGTPKHGFETGIEVVGIRALPRPRRVREALVAFVRSVGKRVELPAEAIEGAFEGTDALGQRSKMRSHPVLETGDVGRQSPKVPLDVLVVRGPPIRLLFQEKNALLERDETFSSLGRLTAEGGHGLSRQELEEPQHRYPLPRVSVDSLSQLESVVEQRGVELL